MLTLLVNLPSPTQTNTKAGFKRPQPDKFRTRSEWRNEGLAVLWATATARPPLRPPTNPVGQCAGVAPAEDVDLALAKLAARNNAEWCDIFCRSHGVTGTFRSDAWASAIRTPALYPDAVALDRSLSVERVLSYVDSSTGCSIKDSFAVMDLRPTGFRVLFEAEWMVRDPQPTPRGPQNGLRWEFVRDSNTLRRWEAEWARDSAPTGFFLPALLRHPDVVILAGYADHQLIAGAILNRSTSAVGLSKRVQ
jgi:hypothetical protein